MNVIVMTGTTNNRDAIELTRHAYQAGAIAFSAIAPFYFSTTATASAIFTRICSRRQGRTTAYTHTTNYIPRVYAETAFAKKLKDMGVKGIKDATFYILLHAQYQRLLKDEHFDVALGAEAMWLPACWLGFLAPAVLG